MTEKHIRIEGPNGETLIVRKPLRLIDLLPSPKEAAKEAAEGDIDDRRVNDPWVRGVR